jgi:DNA-binding transcriptional ArsR family regulator
VEGIEAIYPPTQREVLDALVAATTTTTADRPIRARQLDGRQASVTGHLRELRRQGLVESVEIIGRFAGWRPTQAGKQAVGESSGEQLVADGGRPVDEDATDMIEDKDARQQEGVNHAVIEVPAGGRDVAKEVIDYRVGPPVNYAFFHTFRSQKLILWGEQLSEDTLGRLGDACHTLEMEYKDMAMYEAARDADRMEGKFVFNDYEGVAADV